MHAALRSYAMFWTVVVVGEQAAEGAPGLEAGATHTGEAWTTSGGIDQASRFLDILNIQISADLEQLIGWTGAKAWVYRLYKNGHVLAGDLTSDLQGVSNIDTGIEALRLQEAWIDQSFVPCRSACGATRPNSLI
ncbi:MAG: hypothetical protein SGJ03_17190 [Alphaproteobacteria bacterium]|nr:hypothetical protein [Alphaproteobacteria bacterium]